MKVGELIRLLEEDGWLLHPGQPSTIQESEQAGHRHGGREAEPGCSAGSIMDTDLERMAREQLIEEVMKLREGIRKHRDSARHELCWHHPALWGLLPERTDPLPVVPDWPQFLQGCLRYRQSLDEQVPDALRTKEPYQR